MIGLDPTCIFDSTLSKTQQMLKTVIASYDTVTTVPDQNSV